MYQTRGVTVSISLISDICSCRAFACRIIGQTSRSKMWKEGRLRSEKHATSPKPASDDLCFSNGLRLADTATSVLELFAKCSQFSISASKYAGPIPKRICVLQDHDVGLTTAKLSEL